jgi:hypothetical protein
MYRIRQPRDGADYVVTGLHTLVLRWHGPPPSTTQVKLRVGLHIKATYFGADLASHTKNFRVDSSQRRRYDMACPGRIGQPTWMESRQQWLTKCHVDGRKTSRAFHCRQRTHNTWPTVTAAEQAARQWLAQQVDVLQQGSVIELSVSQYQQLSDEVQRYLYGFRVSIPMALGGGAVSEAQLPLDPYYFGLWLGDGRSCGATIYNTNDTVSDWVVDYGRRLGCGISDRLTEYDGHPNWEPLRTVSFLRRTGESRNWVIDQLRSLRVLGNKHIPALYLHASRDIRLRLLAGIVDSDGCLRHTGAEEEESTFYYRVEMGRQLLVEQIAELTRSLGFSASTVHHYTDTTWMINFGGPAVYDVPARIPNKSPLHVHGGQHVQYTLQPLTSYIDIEEVKADVGETLPYIGITTDGNQRFLLHDNTCVHNCAGQSYTTHTILSTTPLCPSLSTSYSCLFPSMLLLRHSVVRRLQVAGQSSFSVD